MKAYMSHEFNALFPKLWDINPDTETGTLSDFCALQFQFFTKGKVIRHDTIELESHALVMVVIENPEWDITNEQLCSIMDEGNHCLSQGSITYEDNMAYILWSNKGHI